jgi:hypothetical protein
MDAMNEALMTAYFRECRRWPDGRQRLAAKGLRALRCNRIARLLGGGLNDGWAGGDGALAAGAGLAS